MGSGCRKPSRSATVPLTRAEHERAPKEVTAVLKSVVQLSSAATDAKLDQALDLLSSVEADTARWWFRDWLAAASTKSRTALLALMQKVIGRAIEPGVLVAEELITEDGGGDVASVGEVASHLKDSLTIDSLHRSGVSLAMQVLSDASTRESSRSKTSSGSTVYIVSSLDRLVLLLRPSLLAHIESSAENLQHWRSLVSSAGLPPLEEHLSLLSCGAKAVILSLTLVAEEAPPLVLVVNRDAALLQAARQLPKDYACVLLPYFESTAGTKVVQGRRVEGGEGHGPRKEFFMAAASDAIKKWIPVALPTPRTTPATDVQVSFTGNKVVVAKILDESTGGGSSPSTSNATRAQRLVSRAVAQGCVGDRLRLELSNGTEIERIITATHGETSISTSEGFIESSFDASSVCGCALQKPVKPLFEFHRGTGQYWFGAYATELDNPSYGADLQLRFLTFGKLLLLAVANRCKISLLFPAIFFRQLLHSDVKFTIDDLKDFDKDLYSSLKKCQKMNASQFKSLKEVEMLPDGMSREEYVAEKVQETFAPKAMQEIRKGFWLLVGSTFNFSGITEGDLRQLLCPVDDLSDKLSLREIFKVEMEDEMKEHDVFANAFWSVVDGLPLGDKKLFLSFVTGLDSLPEPGTERLLVELPFSAFSKEEHLAMLDLLPQAHTCSNTLELPNYYEALKESGKIPEGESSPAFSSALRELLHTKLLVAIRETSGYELDATADAAAVSPVATATSNPEPVRPSIAAVLSSSDPARAMITPPVPVAPAPAVAEPAAPTENFRPPEAENIVHADKNIATPIAAWDDDPLTYFEKVSPEPVGTASSTVGDLEPYNVSGKASPDIPIRSQSYASDPYGSAPYGSAGSVNTDVDTLIAELEAGLEDFGGPIHRPGMGDTHTTLT